MIGEYCFECGKEATENHHVIPQSLGGTKTVPLCGGCHSLVHGGYFKRRDDHIELTKEGLKRAKERGVVLGNQTNLKEAQSKGHVTIKSKAMDFALQIITHLENHLATGATYEVMTDYLNSEGIPAARNGKWQTSTVFTIIKRAGFRLYKTKGRRYYSSKPPNKEKKNEDTTAPATASANSLHQSIH